MIRMIILQTAARIEWPKLLGFKSVLRRIISLATAESIVLSFYIASVASTPQTGFWSYTVLFIASYVVTLPVAAIIVFIMWVYSK